jgi:hypothetical protein
MEVNSHLHDTAVLPLGKHSIESWVDPLHQSKFLEGRENLFPSWEFNHDFLIVQSVA